MLRAWSGSKARLVNGSARKGELPWDPKGPGRCDICSRWASWLERWAESELSTRPLLDPARWDRDRLNKRSSPIQAVHKPGLLGGFNAPSAAPTQPEGQAGGSGLWSQGEAAARKTRTAAAGSPDRASRSARPRGGCHKKGPEGAPGSWWCDAVAPGRWASMGKSLTFTGSERPPLDLSLVSERLKPVLWPTLGLRAIHQGNAAEQRCADAGDHLAADRAAARYRSGMGCPEQPGGLAAAATATPERRGCWFAQIGRAHV